MSEFTKDDLQKAKAAVMRRKREQGKLKDMLRAKREGKGELLKFLYPGLKKKGFTKQILEDLGEETSLLPPDDDENVQFVEKKADGLDAEISASSMTGLDAEISASSMAGLDVEISASSIANQKEEVKDNHSGKDLVNNASDSSNYDTIMEVHDELDDHGTVEDPHSDSSDSHSDAEHEEEPDFMNDAAAADDAVKQKDEITLTDGAVSAGVVDLSFPDNSSPEPAPKQEENEVQTEEQVEAAEEAEAAKEETGNEEEAEAAKEDEIEAKNETEKANQLKVDLLPDEDQILDVDLSFSEKVTSELVSTPNMSNYNREALITEIQSLQQKITTLKLENEEKSMQIESLQSKDDSRQVDVLRKEIADLNEILALKEEDFINEKQDLKADHDAEIERVREENERFNLTSQVRRQSSVQPDTDKIQENQERLERLQEIMDNQLQVKEDELRKKTQQIAELEDRLQSDKSHVRERSRSVFHEEWEKRLEESSPKDLFAMHDNMKDQVQLVSEFLQVYEDVNNWRIQTKPIGNKDVTVYTLKFGEHEINVRFSILMPSMMYLGQAIGIEKSTYSFASLINSGDGARKYFFAEACGDIYHHLNRRGETPAFGFVFSFLTSMFSLYDGIEHLAGRRVPFYDVPEGTLPADVIQSDANAIQQDTYDDMGTTDV